MNSAANLIKEKNGENQQLTPRSTNTPLIMQNRRTKGPTINIPKNTQLKASNLPKLNEEKPEILEPEIINNSLEEKYIQEVQTRLIREKEETEDFTIKSLFSREIKVLVMEAVTDNKFTFNEYYYFMEIEGIPIQTKYKIIMWIIDPNNNSDLRSFIEFYDTEK